MITKRLSHTLFVHPSRTSITVNFRSTTKFTQQSCQFIGRPWFLSLQLCSDSLRRKETSWDNFSMGFAPSHRTALSCVHSNASCKQPQHTDLTRCHKILSRFRMPPDMKILFLEADSDDRIGRHPLQLNQLL